MCVKNGEFPDKSQKQQVILLIRIRPSAPFPGFNGFLWLNLAGFMAENRL